MFDLIVIGGGTGGLTVARLVAQAGSSVALAERREPGGDCLWTGCVPTKALAHVAKVAHVARSGAALGVVAGNVRLDYEAVRAHIARAQTQAGRVDSADVIRGWGVELVRGEARFVEPHTVEVDGQRLQGRTIVIATGALPALPPLVGLRESGCDTHVELLEWRTLPASLAILGGGASGVEFAQIMRRFGVEVTLIEAAPSLLPSEHAEASAVVERVLAREGVAILTGARVTRVERSGSGLILDVAQGDGREPIACERLLVAAGRAPALEGLNLQAAGVRASSRGIAVDGQLRTSQPHIFAVGDVNGSPQFTHVAEDQGRTVASILLNHTPRLGRRPRWNGRVLPRVTFTDPEVASVGQTEHEAGRQRQGVRTWMLPLTAVDRAATMGVDDGFLKLVTASGWTRRVPGLAARIGDEIVGACLVAPGAGDLLMPVVTAMRARLPAGLLAWGMQAYPTMALGIRQVAGLAFEPGPAGVPQQARPSGSSDRAPG